MRGRVVRIRSGDEYDYRVDRRSKWGNPHVIGQPHPATGAPMTRADVLELYAADLDARLLEDPGFLEPLRGKVIACHCRPKRGFQGELLCHGQIIVGRLEGIDPATVE